MKVEEIEQARPKAVVLRSNKASGFVAGADVREFSALDDEEQAYELVRSAQRVFDRLEGLPCPTVAALHGFALGGGLELALACRYRVGADDGLALGLPEVMLGIHPGFGGTVRTVRLVGVTAAMDLMLTGRNVRPDKALRMGLVDRVVPAADLRSAAASMALNPGPVRRAPLAQRYLSSWPMRRLIATKIEQQVARRAKRGHYPAPYAIVELWRRHGGIRARPTRRRRSRSRGSCAPPPC